MIGPSGTVNVLAVLPSPKGAGGLIRGDSLRRWPGRGQCSRLCFAWRAGDQIEAKEPAFDRAVPHGHAARFLQTHLAGQLEVGREQMSGPAGVLFFPVGGKALKEVIDLLTGFGLRVLAPAGRAAPW